MHVRKRASSADAYRVTVLRAWSLQIWHWPAGTGEPKPHAVGFKPRIVLLVVLRRRFLDLLSADVSLMLRDADC